MEKRSSTQKPPLFDNKQRYLTDGGLETTLVFHEGIELPHFAAFELVTHPQGMNALLKYYRPYLHLARSFGLHYILEAPTWRANTDWGFRLGYSHKELYEINRKAIRFLKELKAAADGPAKILISGCTGPRGDGYVAEKIMTADEARKYHLAQIQAFADEQADLVTAMTLNYSDEAAGVAEAAREAGLPVVISFTVETDGRLPGGETLQEAIERTDRLTGDYATHFMINCAHPQHFKHILKGPGGWKDRIRGLRANASTKSHAELDESETLDTGDKCLLAEGYFELMQLLPALTVIGGCCGTDHTHLEEVCKRILKKSPMVL